MGDTQITKAAETVRVTQKIEDRPPHEREYVPSAIAEAVLLRAAASDDPTTPPQHLARVLRRLTAPHQAGFLLQCQRHYGNACVQRMVSSRDNGHSSRLEQEQPIARKATKITPVDSPSIQRQPDLLGLLGQVGIAYGAAVIIGKNSVYELKGSGKFEPNIFLRAYLHHHKGQALINVKFGGLARGKMYVEDRGADGYRAAPTNLPMTHPEISPAGRGNPSLIVQIGPNDEITGTLGVTKPLPPNSIGAAFGSPEAQARFLALLIGQSGVTGKLENIMVRNEVKGGHLDFVYTFKNTLHKGTYLIGSVVMINEAFAFSGTLHTSAKGVVPADTEIQRDKTGNLIGRQDVSTDWEAKGFKGKLALTYEDGVL